MSKRILAIDAGNTRVKWGVHAGNAWLAKGAVATAEVAGQTQLRDVMRSFDVDHIVVSNVAGQAIAQAIAEQVQMPGKSINVIEASAGQCGVFSHYDQPALLGTDRWAALIAAHADAVSLPHPQLVVMAGTALTVDTLTAAGHFLGGIIAPGMKMMHTALSRGTANLPLAQGNYQTFPTNTDNAIASGTIEACAGAITRMYSHLSAREGEAPRCVASGGAMRDLAVHLPFPVLINENLVLDGLIVIARSSRAIYL